MEEKLVDGDATPNLESLQKVRLTALLHDLMKEGKLEAAQLLGVNYKTLAAAVDSGTLTPRLSDALEKVLLSREIEAFEKVRERVDEMEGRVEAVEKQTRGIPRRDRGGRREGGGAPHGADGGTTCRREEANPGSCNPGRGGRQEKCAGSPAVQEDEPIGDHDGASARRRECLRRRVAAGGRVAQAA